MSGLHVLVSLEHLLMCLLLELVLQEQLDVEALKVLGVDLGQPSVRHPFKAALVLLGLTAFGLGFPSRLDDVLLMPQLVLSSLEFLLQLVDLPLLMPEHLLV